MEITIKINSFDIMKLKELRDILEKYKIEKINNYIKNEDKIEIVYHEEKIKLNEKFNFNIKLIRNKYYRQLLNIINITNDIDKIVDKYNSAVDRYYTYLGIIEDLMKIDSSNYKDILKIALINYIGVYNFDNIFELTKDEMLELKEYKYGTNNTNIATKYVWGLLGMYCHNNEKLFSALESKIDGKELAKMKECNKFILICPELIQEFCVKHIVKFKECEIRDVFELYTIIFNKVLVHEIGHGVFDYTSVLYDNKNECRANYFASLTFDGTFDKIIKTHTDIQEGLYLEPKLITDDDDIANIKKYLYDITT